MDTCWLIAFTTYGTWLPGDPGPPVSSRAPDVPVERRRPRMPPGPRAVRIRDGPTSAPAARTTSPRRAPRRQPRIADGPPLPAVGRYASLATRAAPVRLSRRQAHRLIAQLRDSARGHGWTLRAAAITPSGVRAVIAADGRPAPAVVLAGLKGDGSRALSAARGGPPRRWWNEGGARHRLGDEAALVAAIRRVRDQPGALATWVDPRWPWP